jgi:ATP-dependent DNA ligase
VLYGGYFDLPWLTKPVAFGELAKLLEDPARAAAQAPAEPALDAAAEPPTLQWPALELMPVRWPAAHPSVAPLIPIRHA